MTTTTLTHADIDRIQTQLWQANKAGKTPVVYAFLGGARDRQIEKILRMGTLKYDCLIDGKLSYDMAIAAPYIVRLEKDHPQTIDILKKGWGNSWGIFATSYPPASFINIRHNCKKIAKVILPNKKKAFFRYYDPRVMRPYLPTCTADEAQQVFGHISEYIMEGEAPGTIHRFTRGAEGVVDINSANVTTVTQTNINLPALTPEDQQILTSLSSQLGEAFISQAGGFLKTKALAHTDPNNEVAIKYLLDSAILLSHNNAFQYDTPNNLADIAHTLDLWGNTYPSEDWAVSVYQRRNELTLTEKVIELFREKAFQQAGPEAMDYSTYCILRFKDRNIDPEYSNQDIFIAANIGLEIAKSHNIKDLNNTYMCTEMVLIYGDNFIIDEQCQPIKAIFEDETRSSFDKTYNGFYWLASAMQHSFEYDSLV